MRLLFVLVVVVVVAARVDCIHFGPSARTMELPLTFESNSARHHQLQSTFGICETNRKPAHLRAPTIYIGVLCCSFNSYKSMLGCASLALWVTEFCVRLMHLCVYDGAKSCARLCFRWCEWWCAMRFSHDDYVWLWLRPINANEPEKKTQNQYTNCSAVRIASQNDLYAIVFI